MYPFVSSYYKKTNKIKSRDNVKEANVWVRKQTKIKRKKRYLILANTLTDML